MLGQQVDIQNTDTDAYVDNIQSKNNDGYEVIW
jgi:hypothetical protein